MILLVLTQFVFRLTFGVAVAMFLTPPAWVTSGFYRVHLWVLLGLNTFAALAVYATRSHYAGDAAWAAALALAVATALASYAGSVLWLYEQRRWGLAVLALVAALALAAALLAARFPEAGAALAAGMLLADVATAGLLLGTTLAAMLLGHWYLNTPSMRLEPLHRLLILTGAFLAARAVIAAAGLLLVALETDGTTWSFWAFVALRWAAGLAGVSLLAWLTWLVLKIPNTQSATGILYAAVILAFIGELTSQLLAADTDWPV